MLLLDNSAWARLESPSLAEARRLEIAALIENDGIAVSAPFLLEAGWSARSAAHHEELLAELLQLPFLPIDANVERGALSAQRDLARRGHHRSASPSDLLIAACAHVNSAGILHYDHDYDVLADLTGLAFESIWLAEPGTLCVSSAYRVRSK
ncbi:MAG: PIN domain-containing protein [Actinomycetota bacterium]|nr:PIN domain-containing protein [Actinomycetota bacterium]